MPEIWLPNSKINIVSSIMLWQRLRNDRDNKISFFEILFFLDSSIKKPPPNDIPKVKPIKIILATFSDMPK